MTANLAPLADGARLTPARGTQTLEPRREPAGLLVARRDRDRADIVAGVQPLSPADGEERESKWRRVSGARPLSTRRAWKPNDAVNLAEGICETAISNKLL